MMAPQKDFYPSHRQTTGRSLSQFVAFILYVKDNQMREANQTPMLLPATGSLQYLLQDGYTSR